MQEHLQQGQVILIVPPVIHLEYQRIGHLQEVVDMLGIFGGLSFSLIHQEYQQM